MPPYSASDTTWRMRVWVPLPHGLVHPSQSSQWVTMQSTGAGVVVVATVVVVVVVGVAGVDVVGTGHGAVWQRRHAWSFGQV